MKNTCPILFALMLATASVAPMSMATTANAATAEDLNRDSQQALNNLYKLNTDMLQKSTGSTSCRHESRNPSSTVPSRVP